MSRHALFFLTLLAAALGPLPALATECQLGDLDGGRVVTVDGAQLPQGKGLSHQRLSVLVWDGDRFVPVAFQIDQRDEYGLVWFEESGHRLSGEPGVFGDDDQLLLMLAEAGHQAPAHAEPDQGELLARLSVGKGCYFYLAKDHPGRSDRYYVHHDLDTGVTRTGLYELRVDPDNELNWQYLSYHSYQGQGSIIDTLKMRMSAGVLSRFTRMNLDNHNLRPRLTGFRQGQIRSVMHLRTRVVFAGIPVMTLQVQAMRYASHYEAHSYARVPDLYRATLKEPEVSVSIDGNAQYGARVYTGNPEVSPVTVTGQPSEAAERFQEQGIDAENNWILFDSGQDFTLLTQLNLPDELKSLPIGLIYQDDETLKVEPEQYPGQLPNLGYVLRGWPDPQELRFAVSLYFDAGLDDLPHRQFAAQRGEPVAVEVSAP